MAKEKQGRMGELPAVSNSYIHLPPAGATWLGPLPHSAEGLAGAHPVGVCVTDTYFTPMSPGGRETSLCD